MELDHDLWTLQRTDAAFEPKIENAKICCIFMEQIISALFWFISNDTILDLAFWLLSNKETFEKND